MSELEIKQFDRRPFTVSAVQVTLDNIEYLANWCKGKIDQAPTKMMGTETLLPCVKIPGQGAHKDQWFTANIGSWIVEFKGSFRVYKPVQFKATFVESETHEQEQYIDSSSHLVDIPTEDELKSVL